MGRIGGIVLSVMGKDLDIIFRVVGSHQRLSNRRVIPSETYFKGSIGLKELDLWARVEVGRSVRRQLQLSNQEVMESWPRVVSADTVRNIPIHNISQ